MLISLVFVAVGLLLQDLVGWFAVALGAAAVIGSAYSVVNGLPRVTVSELGIESSYLVGERSVRWNEVVSMREVKLRRRFPSTRLLAIRIARPRTSWLTRLLYGADCAMYVSGFERPPEEC
jgi:hypothetical protein